MGINKNVGFHRQPVCWMEQKAAQPLLLGGLTKQLSLEGEETPENSSVIYSTLHSTYVSAREPTSLDVGQVFL